MKGIVFTEFVEMIETRFGMEVVDRIIEDSNLPSGGSYTSVGTYEFAELVSLIDNLSKQINVPFHDLVYEYGMYFFKYLQKSYPAIFEMYKNAPDFLNAVESHIHVQVRKIYPDAELPSFDVIADQPDHMEMIYSSERGLYKFAQALMEKTFEHYKEKAQIEYVKMNDQGTKVKFIIHYGKGNG